MERNGCSPELAEAGGVERNFQRRNGGYNEPAIAEYKAALPARAGTISSRLGE